MHNENTQFIAVNSEPGANRRIAYLNAHVRNSDEPGLVWFPGLNSTMTGAKVSALSEWAGQTGRSVLRFEYSGHGSSDGELKDGTIGMWLEESLAILEEVAHGPQILIGSSMGSWLILLILRAIANGDPRVKNLPTIEGAFLIAPAWDMTEELMWKQFPDEAIRVLETQGFYEYPTRYDNEPYTITRQLIEEGRNHLIGDDKFKPPCPVRIMHGINDPDVPWLHANKLSHMLLGENVMLSLIQDGDHRLSREKDIKTMLYIINDLYRSISQKPHFI